MEVKVLSKDFLGDDSETTRHALKLDTIKRVDNLKFKIKSKPNAPKQPRAAKIGATYSKPPTILSAANAALAPERLTVAGGLSWKDEYPPLSEDEKREALKGAADVLSMFDRSLKYEVIEEAKIVQLHVIDNRDGKVVRKVPVDLVVEFIKAVKEKLDDVGSESDELYEIDEPEGLDVKA
ncbi:hypothetical protein AGMMS50276_20770 [Synergistales bacterium]|nr:hypothetical protein AGMMS50276_20770 [Synergistales bacterium]